MSKREKNLTGAFVLGTLIVLATLAHNQGSFGAKVEKEIFYELGPKRAREYYIEIGAKNGSDVAVFGYAWASFSLGDFASAEEACNHLSSNDMNEVIEAGCFYIRGYIYLTREQYDLAEQSFTKALAQYKGDRQGELRSMLGMAYLNILKTDYKNAEYWLEKAKPTKEDQDQISGFWWAMKKIIFLWRDNNYSQALDAGNRAAKFYESGGQRSAMASQLTSCGILRMAMGDWVGGTMDANEAKGILLGLEDEAELSYNAAAWYFRSRCLPLEEYELAQANNDFARAKVWAEDKGDKVLLRWLSWIDSISCPIVMD